MLQEQRASCAVQQPQTLSAKRTFSLFSASPAPSRPRRRHPDDCAAHLSHSQRRPQLLPSPAIYINACEPMTPHSLNVDILIYKRHSNGSHCSSFVRITHGIKLISRLVGCSQSTLFLFFSRVRVCALSKCTSYRVNRFRPTDS